VIYRRDKDYYRGQEIDLGLVARVSVGGVQIVLTSERPHAIHPASATSLPLGRHCGLVAEPLTYLGLSVLRVGLETPRMPVPDSREMSPCAPR
jgi:hypothetical protein